MFFNLIRIFTHNIRDGIKFEINYKAKDLNMDNKNFQSKTGFNLENTYLTLPNIFFSEQNPKGSKILNLLSLILLLLKNLGLMKKF